VRATRDGLAGEEIPDGARILSVADAWDVITSDRTYRAERSPHEAIEECRRCAGSQFAAEVVAAFDSPIFARFARILTNERTARQANEQQLRAADDAVLQLQCECFMADCQHRIEIARSELETVRAHPRRFIVHSGHEVPDVERIILHTDQFVVVEKRM
jgi:hypothetical protein